VSVTDVERFGPDVARVRYWLGVEIGDVRDPNAALISGSGAAVRRDGTWRVGLDTACTWVRSLGETCPADVLPLGRVAVG
jgi:hypothetical protein